MRAVLDLRADCCGICCQCLNSKHPVAFTDINEHNLEMVTELCQRDIDENGLSSRFKRRPIGEKRCKDAKYVFCTIRVGGLEAFQHDVDIPLKYGVDQCVGDTLCAGGIMYGQRGIAEMLDICKDIREVAAPDVAAAQLCESDGDADVGLQSIRRRADDRPMSRRAARTSANRRCFRAEERRSRHYLRGHQSSNVVYPVQHNGRGFDRQAA